MSGILYLVSTPIGNIDDISFRAIKTLWSVDSILCEDTRRTGMLLKELRERYPSLAPDRDRRLIPFYDQIEEQKLPEIIQQLEEGKHIALVSDSGTPLINDPGFRLVNEARKRSIQVTAIPGPTAAIVALILSGLPCHTFAYLGFLPESSSARIKRLQTYANVPSTYILYCAPHKLRKTLLDMQQVFGDIDIVIARELTKVHEEVLHGTISSFLEKEFKGELVILFSTHY